MADEKTGEEEQAKKKSPIMFIVIILVAVLASAGGTWFLLQPEEVVEVTEEEATEEVIQKALYHNLRPPFIVNAMTGNKSRYLQADLTIMSRNQPVIEAIINHAPLIRSRINNLLVDQDFLTMQTQEGKEELAENLRVLVEQVVQEQDDLTGVESVLLTNFVMQ